MKSKSAEGSGKKRIPGQHITMRFVVEDPVVGWRMFPVAKVTIAYRFGLQVPEWSGRTMRVALALVILEGKKLHELHRLEPSKWTIDSDGWIEPEVVMPDSPEYIDFPPNATDTETGTKRLSGADVIAIRRCLRLPERGS